MTGKGFNVCPVLSGIKHAFHCNVSSLSVSIIKFKSLEFLGLCNIEFQERLKNNAVYCLEISGLVAEI